MEYKIDFSINMDEAANSKALLASKSHHANSKEHFCESFFLFGRSFQQQIHYKGKYKVVNKSG